RRLGEFFDRRYLAAHHAGAAGASRNEVRQVRGCQFGAFRAALPLAAAQPLPDADSVEAPSLWKERAGALAIVQGDDPSWGALALTNTISRSAGAMGGWTQNAATHCLRSHRIVKTGKLRIPSVEAVDPVRVGLEAQPSILAIGEQHSGGALLPARGVGRQRF